MKSIFYLLVFLISPLLLNSQTPFLLRSTLSSGGASISFSSGGEKIVFQQSIGQYSVTGVFRNKNVELRQGFIQPVMIIQPFHEKENKNMSIYPNPFSSVFFVKLNEEASVDLELKITDLAGREVYAGKIPASEIIQIIPGSLCRGVYILTLRVKDIRAIYKIIKN